MLNTRLSTPQRIMTVFLSFVMCLFCLPLDCLSYAVGETADEGSRGESFTMLLNSAFKNVEGDDMEDGFSAFARTGDTIYFDFQSALSAANTRGAVTAKIYIKPGENCEDYIDFKYFVDNGTDKVLELPSSNGEGKNIQLTLRGPLEEEGDKNGAYVIEYTIEQGDSIAGVIAFSYKEGYTPDGSSTEIWVETDNDEDDSSVLLDGETLEGSFKIGNRAEFDWSDLTKEVTSGGSKDLIEI